MRYVSILLLSLIATLIHSCSTEEDIPSPVEPIVDIQTENVYYSQNKWIYSKMDQHYLWREDLPDSLECDFDQTPRDFFESLLSEKDRFSYMLSNPYYEVTEKVDMGFSYQNYIDASGNQASLILFVTNDYLSKKGIKRGDWLQINTISSSQLSYRRVTITPNGLFKSIGGEVSLTLPTPTKQSSVLLDSIYNEKIGYLCYTEFNEIEDLVSPLVKFHDKGIQHLILDLRYNPGGYVSTCKFLANCIAPEKAYGNIFQITRYNDLISQENIKNTGEPFLCNIFGFPTHNDNDKGGYQIIPLNLSQLIVLTSKHTASASEAIILCLKPYMDVVQFGETTVGKGVGSYTIYDKKYKYAIQPITMQYYNQLNQTVPNSGLQPDFFIEDGYNTSKKEIGDMSEPLLMSALRYIMGEALPVCASRSQEINTNIAPIPIGDPSYITEFYNKYRNESN